MPLKAKCNTPNKMKLKQSLHFVGRKVGWGASIGEGLLLEYGKSQKIKVSHHR